MNLGEALFNLAEEEGFHPSLRCHLWFISYVIAPGPTR